MASRYARLLPTPYASKLTTAFGQKNEPYSFSLGENKYGRTQHPSQQKSHPLWSGFSVGWDGWVRTIEMPESKSGALPLGYIPLFFAFVLYHTLPLLSSIIFFFTSLSAIYKILFLCYTYFTSKTRCLL